MKRFERTFAVFILLLIKCVLGIIWKITQNLWQFPSKISLIMEKASISSNWLIKINYCHHRDLKRVKHDSCWFSTHFPCEFCLPFVQTLKNSHVNTQIKFNGNVKHGKILWLRIYSFIWLFSWWLFDFSHVCCLCRAQ